MKKLIKRCFFLGGYQGSVPNYPTYPNTSQYSAYGNEQYSQNNNYSPSFADVMNAPNNPNQQHGPGFNYNNTQYHHPNQYRQ